MRTTLTLNNDVAAVLEWLCKTARELINQAPRSGLSEMTGPAKRRERLWTRTVSLGGLRIPRVDNTGEALAVAEGENFK
jgi:hypothetical protein